MKNDVFCKPLCHNIGVLMHSQCGLGIDPVFWPNEPSEETADVLPMTRPG